MQPEVAQAETTTEWHQIKGTWLLMRGSRILAIVDKAEGLPVEAFTSSPVHPLFTDIEEAKKHAEKNIKRMRQPPPDVVSTMYLPLLKSVVEKLEASTATRQAQIADEDDDA